MRTRELFHKMVNFESVDQALRVEWAPWWTETLDAWGRAGMDAELLEETRHDPVVLQRHFGLGQIVQEWIHPRGLNCPEPEKFGGAICEDEDDYHRLIASGMLCHDLDRWDFSRFARYGNVAERDDSIFWLTLDGFFWYPRTLFGIEGHLFAFYDYPELMKEMNQHAVDYYLKVLDRVLPKYEIDFMTFAEDLSYNHGPMLSREQFEEFVVPYYNQLIPLLKDHHIKVFVDSDGDVSECAEWFLDAGVEGILPLERAAGVDVAQLRQRFPKLLMMGGFNKMIMHSGEEALRAEFERLLPVIKGGGFIASCDHQTPPDVTVEDYRLYLKLWDEYLTKR